MKNRNYHIGLDIGTSSIGWAIMDDDFKIMRVKGKKGIGVRLFNEGNTAAERRSYRTTRRRYARRKWRLRLLEEIFDPYMVEVDPYFFARMKESNISPKDDRKKYAGSILFPDLENGDKDFYDQYPTIHHLRKALMTEDRKFDLREIYLAIHHIVKYRGNFLMEGSADDFNVGKLNLTESFHKLNDLYEGQVTLPTETTEIEKLLLDNTRSKADRKKVLVSVLQGESKDIKPWATALSNAFLGYKTDAQKLLFIDSDLSKGFFNLSDDGAADVISEIYSEVDDNQQGILEVIYKLYSQIRLSEIIPSGKSSISQVMVDKYEAHKSHLKIIKDNLGSMHNDQFDKEYSAYLNAKQSEDDFNKKVLKLVEEDLGNEIQSWIDSPEGFLPKQRTSSNGVLPHQIHQAELDQIIKKQSTYYPWLAEVNPNEKRRNVAKYKLDELVAFRVPYYVGPLVDNSKYNNIHSRYAWMVRNHDGEITPWNFDEMVDRDQSAENFIKRMTTKDTYLLGEDVLPAQSLLYERFKVLNELNLIKVRGEKLSSDLKHAAYEELFKSQKSVSKKRFINFLNCHNEVISNGNEVTGFSDETKFNSQLTSYNDLKQIIPNQLDDLNFRDDIEKIIEWSTVFEDQVIFKRKLKTINWLNDQQKEQLSHLRYRGWGRLSKKLLSGLRDKNGQRTIDIMWDTPQTFMQIQSLPAFKEQIEGINGNLFKDNSLDGMLEDAYTSPQNKKAIRQVVKVVADIQKAMKGQSPTSISLEFAREDEGNQRTVSRKKQIESKFKEAVRGFVDDDVNKELQGYDRISDRLYLYFTQNGRDMYTGKRLDIDRLSQYDIDHIIPQAFLKDDSLDNRVLVDRGINNSKSDNYVMLQPWAKDRQYSLWKPLLDNGLISKTKYRNLTTNPGSINKYQREGFIKRQLVETRQVIKLVTNYFNTAYEDSAIISVRAGLTHQIRTQFDFIKNRNVNDFHHAFDAYLTTFVGRYLYRRYPSIRSYFVYGKYQASGKDILNKLSRFNFLQEFEIGDGQKILDPNENVILDRDKVLNELNEVYRYKYMLVTREVMTKTGPLYNETIYGAGNANSKIPISKNKPVDIYGGRSGNNDAYMTIVKLPSKKGDIYKVYGIPLSYYDELEKIQQKSVNQYINRIYDILSKQIKKQFKVVVPRVLYNQLIKDYGENKDRNELFTLASSKYRHNARQLSLPISDIETIYKMNNSDFDVKEKRLDKLFNDILEKINRYFDLFDARNFRSKLNENSQLFFNLQNDTKKSVIMTLINCLHTNAFSSNIKELKLSQFGAIVLTGGIKLSENAQLIYQSPTGLFERRVTLKNL